MSPAGHHRPRCHPQGHLHIAQREEVGALTIGRIGGGRGTYITMPTTILPRGVTMSLVQLLGPP